MTTTTIPTHLDHCIEESFLDLEFALDNSTEAFSELRRQISAAKGYFMAQARPITKAQILKTPAEIYDTFSHTLCESMRHLLSCILAYGTNINGKHVLPLTTENVRNMVKDAVMQTEEFAYGTGRPQVQSLSLFKDFEPQEVRQVDREYHGRHWAN